VLAVWHEKCISLFVRIDTYFSLFRKEFTMSQNPKQNNDQDKNQLSSKEVSLDKTKLDKTKIQPPVADHAKNESIPAATRLPARAEDQFTMGKRHS
jgi:hypothetical protein